MSWGLGFINSKSALEYCNSRQKMDWRVQEVRECKTGLGRDGENKSRGYEKGLEESKEKREGSDKNT